MKPIAFNGRLLLRKILTGLSLGAVAVTFQACYGMPQVTLNGTVKSADTQEPIPGIQVSIYDGYNCLTDSNGVFEIYTDEYGQTIQFKDIDGAENGEFHNKNVVTDKKDKGSINVLMDRKE
jgi:hypothetical protein